MYFLTPSVIAIMQMKTMIKPPMDIPIYKAILLDFFFSVCLGSIGGVATFKVVFLLTLEDGEFTFVEVWPFLIVFVTVNTDFEGVMISWVLDLLDSTIVEWLEDLIVFWTGAEIVFNVFGGENVARDSSSVEDLVNDTVLGAAV